MAKPRLATLDDLPVLVLHRRRMWEDIGGFTQVELDDADRVYRRWARARLRSGTLVAWITEARGEPVASGAVWVQRIQPRPRHPTGATPYLLSMYTEPEHRGQGHAPAIVRAATAWAKKEGHPRMTLHASEMGRPIYEKLGWTRTWEMKLDLTPARARRRSPTGSGTRSGHSRT